MSKQHIALESRVHAKAHARIHSQQVLAYPEVEFDVKNRISNVRICDLKPVKRDRCGDRCTFRGIIYYDNCPDIRTRVCDGRERFRVSAKADADIECPRPCESPKRRKRCEKKNCRCRK